MAHYQRLSLMEREELSRMLATGASLRAAAQALQRAPSTLSRELTRHRTSPLTYRAVPAHQRAQRWAHQPRKPRTLAVHARLRAAVLDLLAHRWSPEQIAHGLPQRYPDDPTMRISHEAIYTYLSVLNGARKGDGYLSNNFGGRLRGLNVDSNPKAAAILAYHRLLTAALTARHFLLPALSSSVHPAPPCWQRG